MAESRDAVQGASVSPVRLIRLALGSGTDCSRGAAKILSPVYRSTYLCSLERAIGLGPAGALLTPLSPTDYGDAPVAV